MQIESLILQIVASISIGTITLTAFFAFVGRKIFEHILQRNVEYLKTDIAHAAQISHERFTAVFNIKFERMISFYDATIALYESLAAVELKKSNRVETQEQIRRIVSIDRVSFALAASKVRPFLSTGDDRIISSIKKSLNDLAIEFENQRDIEKSTVHIEKICQDVTELSNAAASAIRTL